MKTLSKEEEIKEWISPLMSVCSASVISHLNKTGL
jgi:hypothetical protein